MARSFSLYGTGYYDPRTSVWQSPDPILDSYMSGETNGGVFNPHNMKLYSYTYNNPVNYTDPTGMCTEDGKDGCTIVSKQQGINLKNPIDPVSPLEVNGHAMAGDGTDREADFSKVHLNDLGASIQKFAKNPKGSLNKAIDQAGESGKPVDISISGLRAGGGFEGDTPISQKGAIGRFAVNVEGKVTTDKDGIWNLTATVRGKTDEQDYPKDSSRPPIASALTSFGAWVQKKLGGDNYDISFKGSQDIQVKNNDD